MAKKIYELSDEEKEKAKELLDFMSKNKNNTNSKISMDLPTANMSKPKNEMPVYDRSSSIDFPRVKIASQQETKNLKKFRESNNFTDTIDNVTGVLGNIGMGIENVIPNMIKYMNEGNKIATKKATNTIIRGVLNRATKNKEFSDKVGQIVGNTLGEKIHSSLNPIAKTNQELNNADIEKWRTNTIQNNISKTNNFLGTKLAELAPSIGNNALPMAVALAPVPGARALSTAMFMTSAGGSYLDDAKARGMNEDEAFGYATIMGTLEGGTEAVISGNMLNKGVKLASGHELSKEILGSYGLDITENFAQEAIMEPLSELTATITGGKESADWNNMGQRMINSGIDGALSAVLLSGVSAGIGSAVNVVNKHNNGQAVTQNEIKTAMKDIQNSGKINVEEVIKGSIEAIKGNNNINVEQNSLSTVNTENTYSNQLKQMASKEITNSNISEDYKTMMLDVLNNMNEVSDADVGSIRQNINSLEEANRLDTKIDSKNDQTRRKKYMQYKNDTNTYDSTEVNEVLDMTPTNRNGRRTVKQWLTVADEIGKRIANKSNAEIEQIAYKSWFDIEPSKSITQYDSQSKTSVAFQKFTSDEWVNTINNAVNKTRSSQNIPNSIEKNNIKEYNNLQLGETKNINTNDLSQLAKDGGYRTTEQIESLRESIRQNGIVEPIEIYRKNDGTFAIENGNHRLKIASELGIEQVPVKLVESWENLGLVKDKTETNILNEGIDGSDTSNRISETNIENDEGSGTGRRSVYDINDKFKNGRTAEKNVGISEGTPNSNQQTSNIKNEGNNRKQGVDDSTSFNMNESSKTQDTSNELETGEWTKQKKEGEKRRKHYESIIKSNYTTDEAKAIAKSLMGTDTYVPESNSKQLELADDRISTTGADSELASLLSRATTGGTIKAEDIAIGERLIQYYSKTGNKTKLQDAIQATAMAGTTAGQTVQAMSLLNHQTPEGQAVWLQRSVDKMNKDLKRTRGEDAEQFKLTPEMLNKITNSENAKVLEQNLNEVYKELGQQVTKTTAQKIDAWRYFSMLANPRTHIRNIVGNTAMGGVQGIKNKVAGGIESAVSKINPDMERNHTVIPASKEVKAFAKADIENVVDRLGLNENKYNPKTRLENNMRTFKSDAMENTIGKAFNLNNKALEAEDGWGLKAGYVKALSEYMTANKLTPDTITDQQLGKARNFAIEQAKEATFHQDSQLASLINQLSNKNKFSKFVLDATLPFKKTPINVAKAGLEYSPVGLVKSAVYDTVQLRKGNITANKYIDNISKGLTGTGIALVGYALANCGVLKATGSDDEDKEKFEEGRGSQNYAITIGNNTYSLDWLAPSGIPLFIGAECYELMKTQKEKKTSSSDEDEYYNKVVDASMNILDSFSNAMNPMTEMSMLSGLTSALKSYDQGSSKMLAGIGTNSIKSYVNQFIPTALGQIAKTTDEYERNTTSTKTGVLPKAIDTTRTQIMNKIPGLRQKLPIKTDIWGQEQKQSDNIALRALENAVFPWARKELNSNNVDKEITKVYENTGESSVFPDTINKNLTIDKKKYVMTSKEFAKYKKQFGETSYELLKNLINSDGYKKLSDSQKQLAIEKIYSYSTEQVKIDYARQNCLKNEQSTLSQVTNAIKKTGGNTSNYFEFLANTQGLDKDSEKLEVLANSKYDEKTKKAIYENSLGKKDTKYDIVKESFTGSGLNMSKYLQYKAQEFKADKKDDGTVNGKSITGSKKDKVFDYIDSIKGATYTQKLILYALEYRPRNASDREIVENYIRNMPNRTVKEKLEIMSKFAGVTLNKPDKEFPDGSYDY
jgi:hypothetical protein